LHAGRDREDVAGADRTVGIAIAFERVAFQRRQAIAPPFGVGRLSNDGASGICTSDSLTQLPLAIGAAAWPMTSP
jgi:hypothetical protein